MNTIATAMRDFAERQRERRKCPPRATSEDVRHIMRQLDLATDLYLSAVDGLMEKYNLACPVGETIDTRDFLGCLRDLLADELTGPLMKRADEWEGN